MSTDVHDDLQAQVDKLTQQMDRVKIALRDPRGDCILRPIIHLLEHHGIPNLNLIEHLTSRTDWIESNLLSE
jgi:hypothetical protein